MANRKLQFSLRLRHNSRPLGELLARLKMKPSTYWEIGQSRVTPRGTTLAGRREDSYALIDLVTFQDTPDVSVGLPVALGILKPYKAEISQFVQEGGLASLGIAWFCERTGGDRISESVLAALVDLRLNLDIYIYLSGEVEGGADHEVGSETS